ATPREIKTMLQDAEPNFKTGGESPNITAITSPIRAALIQCILVMISCSVIIREAKKKTISGTAIRIATNGAVPGITKCPNLGTIKN
ncbi:unnamed protein product, partial [marine sediment metagenome]